MMRDERRETKGDEDVNEILRCDREGCDFAAPDGWERDDTGYSGWITVQRQPDDKLWGDAGIDAKLCSMQCVARWAVDHLAAEIAVCHDAMTLGGHRVPEVQKWTL